MRLHDLLDAHLQLTFELSISMFLLSYSMFKRGYDLGAVSAFYSLRSTTYPEPEYNCYDDLPKSLTKWDIPSILEI
jgi:hypothetical protein